MRVKNDDAISTPPNGLPVESQPKWRQDFPIDIPQDEYVSRRDFTKYMVLISFAFAVGQFWIVLQNKFRRAKEADVAAMEIASLERMQIGQSISFEYPEKHNRCVLVRTAEDQFVAYSQKCTHLSCPVIPDSANSVFHCPCHEGLFDMKTGAALAGPPRRPLTRVRLQIRDNKIFAVGLEAPV